MDQNPGLIDVSELAYAVGFRILRGEPALLPSKLPDGHAPPVPVYLTRRLWADLGGAGGDLEAYRSRARELLAAAHQVALEQTVRHSYWRAGFQAAVAARPISLWLILGHSYSDGYAIGYGPGDFWGAPGSSLRPTQI